MREMFEVGDILFLERVTPSIPYSSGCWVLCRRQEASAYVALVGAGPKGPCAIDNWYKISIEELSAFSALGERADVPEPSAEALKQDWEYRLDAGEGA